jgi:hypothetical protein
MTRAQPTKQTARGPTAGRLLGCGQTRTSRRRHLYGAYVWHIVVSDAANRGGNLAIMGIGQRTYSSLRSLVPRPLRRPLGNALEEFGTWTSAGRLMPSFIIVGGQRCGTNSLYEYVVGHPSVARALPEQEIHFFDLNFDRGEAWYRGHFPTRWRSKISERKLGTQLVTGECSPYYMFHPLAPQRIRQLLPGIKLLVLLRNPVDRAFSQYHHERARGFETLSFEEAIEQEPERLRGEEQKIRRDPIYHSFSHQHFSYTARGRYADQLETLFSLYPRENIMVLFSEQFFGDPAAALSKALRFLKLPPLLLERYTAYNSGRYADMAPGLRARLTEHFADTNERLYRMLDTDFRWH